jgi:hypothetical protein
MSTEFNVTNIQFVDLTHEQQVSETQFETIQQYSANVWINNEFIIQVSGNDDEAEKAGFAPSSSCYATTEKAQEEASENYDIDEIIEQIESAGFENNFNYLQENGSPL